MIRGLFDPDGGDERNAYEGQMERNAPIYRTPGRHYGVQRQRLSVGLGFGRRHERPGRGVRDQRHGPSRTLYPRIRPRRDERRRFCVPRRRNVNEQDRKYAGGRTEKPYARSSQLHQHHGRRGRKRHQSVIPKLEREHASFRRKRNPTKERSGDLLHKTINQRTGL